MNLHHLVGANLTGSNWLSASNSASKLRQYEGVAQLVKRFLPTPEFESSPLQVLLIADSIEKTGLKKKEVGKCQYLKNQHFIGGDNLRQKSFMASVPGRRSIPLFRPQPTT